MRRHVQNKDNKEFPPRDVKADILVDFDMSDDVSAGDQALPEQYRPPPTQARYDNVRPPITHSYESEEQRDRKSPERRK